MKPILLVGEAFGANEAKSWQNMPHEERLAIVTKNALIPYKRLAMELGIGAEILRKFKIKNKIIGLPRGAQSGNKNAIVHGIGRNTIMRLAQRTLREAGRDLFVCERCKSKSLSTAYPIHHKNRDRTNNSTDNLEVLCHSCHALEHQHELDRDVEGRYY